MPTHRQLARFQLAGIVRLVAVGAAVFLVGALRTLTFCQRGALRRWVDVWRVLQDEGVQLVVNSHQSMVAASLKFSFRFKSHSGEVKSSTHPCKFAK